MRYSTHAQHAARFTKRQLSEVPFLVYSGRSNQLEFIIPKPVFRDQVCKRLEAQKTLLEDLRTVGFLNEGKNGKVYVRRKFAEPLDSARVVSLKPAIRTYKTSDEKQAAVDREHRREDRRRQQYRGLPRGMFSAPMQRAQ